MQADIINETENIPDGFDSYTLLLIPEPEWLEREDSKINIKKLFQRFHAFGTSIGERNLSLWFYSTYHYPDTHTRINIKAVVTGPEITYSQLIKKEKLEHYDGALMSYDFGRARSYCDRYHLNYNKGPYIVYTEDHPDSISKPEIILQLNGIATDQFIIILNKLEQSVRSGEKKPMRLRAALLYERIKCVIKENKADIFKLVGLLKGIKG